MEWKISMAEKVDLEDLISQVEAAELRGVSRASINELVKRGRLNAVEIGGKTFLRRSEVLSFEPEKGGRPPKLRANGTGKKRGSKK